MNLDHSTELARPHASAVRWGTAVIGVASTAVLLMHAYLGTYSRFMADDYCSAAESLRLGILRAAWFWYRTWTGRYSANLLDAVFGALGPRITPVVTFAVLILWLASLFAVVRHFSKSRAGSDHPLLSFSLAAAILSLTLALSPNVPQALYWGQGMRSVIPPLIVLAADAAVFIFYRGRLWSTRARLLWSALSFVLAFGAGGFSETYAALQVVMLGLAIVALFFFAKGRPTGNDVLYISCGLAGAVLSVAVIMLSPGNPVRAAFFPAPPGPMDLLRISLHSYGIFFSQVASSALKLLALAAAFTVGLWSGLHFDMGPRGWRAAAWILLAGLILTFSCFPPAAYGESTVPPDRTLLIPSFLLVLVALLTGAAISRPLAERWRGLAPLSFAAILLLVIAAGLSLFQLLSVQPTYAAYARAWARFDGEMVRLRGAGASSAVISTADLKANNWAGLNTLGDNPRFWLNQCVSDYYGVKVISTTP